MRIVWICHLLTRAPGFEIHTLSYNIVAEARVVVDRQSVLRSIGEQLFAVSIEDTIKPDLWVLVQETTEMRWISPREVIGVSRLQARMNLHREPMFGGLQDHFVHQVVLKELFARGLTSLGRQNQIAFRRRVPHQV